MTFSSFEHHAATGTVIGSVLGFGSRIAASWQKHRAERALEGLSYDTLKDIGFPSVDMADKDRPAR